MPAAMANHTDTSTVVSDSGVCTATPVDDAVVVTSAFNAVTEAFEAPDATDVRDSPGAVSVTSGVDAPTGITTGVAPHAAGSSCNRIGLHSASAGIASIANSDATHTR